MKPNEGRQKKMIVDHSDGIRTHNLLHGSLVRSWLSYPYRQLLCPTATTSTKFIQHSIYIDSIAIKNKAIIEKLMIIQRKKEKKKAKFLSKEYRWLVTRSFDSDSTRKKDLLQARWAGHTTDQVGLPDFCPDAGNFTGFQVAGVSSALLLWNAKFACRSDFKVLAWTYFRHLRVHRGHNDRPYMKYIP